MRCSKCRFWKNVSENGHGECTCHKSDNHKCRTMFCHECEEGKPVNQEMMTLRTDLVESIDELKQLTEGRHMNDLEYSRYNAFQRVIDRIDEILESED